MKTQRITSTLVAALVAVVLAGSGSAFADSRYDRHGHNKADRYDKRPVARLQSRQEKRHVRRDVRNDERHRKAQRKYYDRQYAYQMQQRKLHRKQHQKKLHRQHKRNHYSNYRYKQYNRYKHYNRHSYYYKDDDSDEKLLVGLLVGGLIGYAINDAQDNDRDYDRYPPAQPAPAPQASVYTAEARGRDTCLQEREYQTRVIVGGREVDAYGTACLQPDGSWTRGPARVARF